MHKRIKIRVMQQQDAKELLRKYREGLATEAEKTLLEDWVLFGKLKELDLTDEEIKAELSLIDEVLPLYKERRLKLWPRIAAAAAILTFIMAAAWFYNGRRAQNISNPNSELVFVSPLGRKTSFKLADGSKIILNGGSKLTVIKSFNGNKRDVQLDGEGYFEVVHNNKKPFIVHTNRIEVKDIGTEFNIKAYSTDKTTEAALIKGAIEITVNDKINGNDKIKSKVLLAPNEKFVIANSEKAEIAKDENLSKKSFTVSPLAISAVSNSIAETDWAQNKLTFDDLPFEDIAAQMERWYGIKLTINN